MKLVLWTLNVFQGRREGECNFHYRTWHESFKSVLNFATLIIVPGCGWEFVGEGALSERPEVPQISGTMRRRVNLKNDRKIQCTVFLWWMLMSPYQQSVSPPTLYNIPFPLTNFLFLNKQKPSMIKLIDSSFKSHKLQTTLAQFWQTQQTSGLFCPSQQARDCMSCGCGAWTRY